MDCAHVRDRLLAGEYGELAPGERAELDKHLEACAACRAEASAWRDLGRTLGALPTPPVEVDLARVYEEAARRQGQRLRRWRRAALAAGAVAAAVLVAVVLKLEIRVGASEVVVRWGGSPDTLPRGPEPPAPAPPAAAPANAEDLQLVKDLVRVMAQEIQARDHRQREELLRLQAHFEALLGRALDYVASNERDVAALYAAQFRSQPKGANP